MITVKEMLSKIDEKIKTEEQKYNYYINKIFEEIEENINCNKYEVSKEKNIKITVKINIPEIREIQKLKKEEQIIIFKGIGDRLPTNLNNLTSISFKDENYVLEVIFYIKYPSIPREKAIL